MTTDNTTIPIRRSRSGGSHLEEIRHDVVSYLARLGIEATLVAGPPPSTAAAGRARPAGRLGAAA